MQRFKNILVAVDLSSEDRFVADGIAAPSNSAIDRAVWLAKANSAQLTFMYVLDPSAIQFPAVEQDVPKSFPDQSTVASEAADRLAKIVVGARQQGVVAEQQVNFGKSWIELIRQVLRNGHDLVIAGTRRFGPVGSMLFGSTGIKLLRKCPCPVWITLPQPDRISSILVAHDLRPVGDLAMELGGSMAQIHDAQLHVFHAVRPPEIDDMFPSRVSAEDLARFRADAQKQIAEQLAAWQLSNAPEVHIETGAAYSQILNLINLHKVELLVMGTVARTGIAGLIIGNTAERLLPHIPCSVLAVKPKGFQSPVTLE